MYLLEPFVRSNDAKVVLTHNEKLCDKSGEEASREAVNVRYGSPKTKEKLLKQGKVGILKRHRTKISGLQIYGVSGLNIACRCHLSRRKKSNTSF